MSERNIILFPKRGVKTPPNSIEDVYEAIANVRKEQIRMMAADIMSQIITRSMEEGGYDLTQDKCDKDLILLYGSLCATIYRSIELEHPVQQLADTIEIKDFRESQEISEHVADVVDSLRPDNDDGPFAA